MTRRAWVSVSVAAAVLIVAGGGLWRWWHDRCDVELPQPATRPALTVATEDVLAEQGLTTRLSVEAANASLRAGSPRLTLLGLPPHADHHAQPLADGSVMISSRGHWELSGDSAQVGNSRAPGHLVSVIDADTDQVRWSRVQVPPSHTAVTHQNRLLVLHQPGGGTLTAVMVDVADGESVDCARLRDPRSDPGLLDASATAAGEGQLVAVYRRSELNVIGLSLLEPDAAGARLDTTVETTVDLDVVPQDVRGDVGVADGVLVANVRSPEAVQAFSVRGGQQLWSYSHDPGGAESVRHQLLDVSPGRVLIQAYRQGSDSVLVDSQLIALDPDTGRQQWSRQQVEEPVPPDLGNHYRYVGVYGDVVLAREREPERDWLVGYDADTGAELWRAVELVTEVGPDRGAYLAGSSRGAALLPDGRGLVEVDLSSGETRTLLEDVQVRNVRADDRTVVVDLLVDGARAVALYDRG